MNPSDLPPLRFLDLTLSTPGENLALDEALLLEAEDGRGPELLRLWEWQAPAVILGAASQLNEDVDEAACARDAVPILRRSSGGGTVLLGPGCLLYSLVLAFERTPPLHDILPSYQFILAKVTACLADVVPGAAPEGTSDLAVRGLKFSGNAQQRKRTHLLHHGTLLYRFDLGQVGRYLRQPKRQPEYRANREHAAFLMNVPLTKAEMVERMRQAWGANLGAPGWPADRVAELMETKYSRLEWSRRR